MLDFLGSIIAYPFRWIDSISPNYVVTLILFAIFMKIVLFPFSIKQQKNSIKQAKLRPYETIIRKKYAGRTDNVSKQKMNEEIMQLYQKENFNPASGCLPMLIQLPILFALYQVIIKPATFLLRFPKELTTKLTEVARLIDDKAATEIVQIDKILHADFSTLTSESATAIKDFLASPVTVKGIETNVEAAFENLSSSFELFSLNLMETPTFGLNALIIIPILVVVFSYLSMKLTRKFTYQPSMGDDNATKSSMAMMDITMPLMSLWISFITPAGIGIYWIIQNVLGVAQQFALYKLFPVPPMTDEDLKAAEAQLKGKQKRVPSEKKPVPEIVEKAPIKKDAKKAPVVRKAQISAHARARVKSHGTVPRAKKRP